MKKHTLLLAVAGLSALVMLVACDALIFPPDDFEPSGTPFNLNPQIDVLSIAGKDAGFPNSGTYPLNFEAETGGAGPEHDTLPPGLLFRSKSNQVQHMLMLKPHPVAVGTKSDDIELGVFCCNEFRHIPRSNDSFELGPVSDNAELMEIASLVDGKDMSGALWTVQRAVWMVTDSTGLNQVYRDSLAALPDETYGSRSGFYRYDRALLERMKREWRGH